jgi:hypothetical protein
LFRGANHYELSLHSTRELPPLDGREPLPVEPEILDLILDVTPVQRGHAGEGFEGLADVVGDSLAELLVHSLAHA